MARDVERGGLAEGLVVHDGVEPSRALRAARRVLDELTEAELVVLSVLVREHLARRRSER